MIPMFSTADLPACMRLDPATVAPPSKPKPVEFSVFECAHGDEDACPQCLLNATRPRAGAYTG